MGEILEQFGFVEEKYSKGDLYGTGDEIISHQWSAHTNGGSLQYIPHENNLYIWSGMGPACREYHVSAYTPEGENAEYGYEVKIKSSDQLVTLLEVLCKKY